VCILGRLRIELKQAVPIFVKLVEDVFSEKKKISMSEAASFKASKLVAALKKIVRDATGNENERMLDTRPNAEECKTYA
jgi:hypothetical protein